jgi:uncharacterized membrane protein YeaQ/YmgE (transglycosylase-associated protein family)
VALAAALDVSAVLVFAAVGRSSHAEGVTLSGVVQTALPFLVGLGIGWAAGRAWRAPKALLPTGVVVWAGTVAGGLVLRWATGNPPPLSFAVVTTGFVGACVLGWRAVGAVRASRARQRAGLVRA